MLLGNLVIVAIAIYSITDFLVGPFMLFVFITLLSFANLICLSLFLFIPIRVKVDEDGIRWKSLTRREKTVAWKDVKLLRYSRNLIKKDIWVASIESSKNMYLFHGYANLILDFSKYAQFVPSELLKPAWGLKTKKIASWCGVPPHEFYQEMGLTKKDLENINNKSEETTN